MVLVKIGAMNVILRGVDKNFPIFYTYFPDLDKIQYRRLTQNFIE
jgi:hypothetical protein